MAIKVSIGLGKYLFVDLLLRQCLVWLHLRSVPAPMVAMDTSSPDFNRMRRLTNSLITTSKGRHSIVASKEVVLKARHAIHSERLTSRKNICIGGDMYC